MSKKRNVNLKAKKLRSLLFDKRAVSVALTTLIISAGVVAAGIAVLYWARSWGDIADQQYANSVTQSQAAISERIAFEYITYSTSNNGTLSVYLINCGLSNNVSIARLYIWNNQSVPIGTFPASGTNLTLYYITDNSASPSAIPPNQGLSIGNDAYFNVTVPPGYGGLFSISSGSYYTIRVVTASGRNYDSSFSIP